MQSFYSQTFKTFFITKRQGKVEIANSILDQINFWIYSIKSNYITDIDYQKASNTLKFETTLGKKSKWNVFTVFLLKKLLFILILQQSSETF